MSLTILIQDDMAIDTEPPRTPIRGRVMLFTSRDKAAEPDLVMMQPVSTQLSLVLPALAGRFSPIQSKCGFCISRYRTNCYSESDSRIYVREDNFWMVKGRYTQALLDKEPLQWDSTPDGKMSLALLAVGFSFIAQTCLAHKYHPY